MSFKENFKKETYRYLRRLVKEGILDRDPPLQAGEYTVFYTLLPDEVDPGESRRIGGVTTTSSGDDFFVEVEHEDGKTEIIRRGG